MSDEKEFKKEWQTVVAITPRPGSWQELARAVTSPALRANQHLNHIYLADVGCGATLIGDEIVNHARGYIPPKERQTSGKEAKIDLPVYTEEDWKAIAQIVDERVRSSGDFTGLRIYGGVNEAIYKRMTEAHSVGSKVRKILEIARAAGSHITKAEKSYAEVAGVAKNIAHERTLRLNMGTYFNGKSITNTMKKYKIVVVSLKPAEFVLDLKKVRDRSTPPKWTERAAKKGMRRGKRTGEKERYQRFKRSLSPAVKPA